MEKTNQSSGDTVDRGREMALYDRLPPAVRRALQDAPIQLGANSARGLLYKYDEHETAQCIAEFIRNGMTSGAIGHTNAYGRQVAGEPWGTVVNWTYTIKRDGWLYKGVHDGRTHPQASKDYPWPSYQLTPRDVTRVVEYYTKERK